MLNSLESHLENLKSTQRWKVTSISWRLQVTQLSSWSTCSNRQGQLTTWRSLWRRAVTSLLLSHLFYWFIASLPCISVYSRTNQNFKSWDPTTRFKWAPKIGRLSKRYLITWPPRQSTTTSCPRRLETSRCLRFATHFQLLSGALSGPRPEQLLPFLIWLIQNRSKLRCLSYSTLGLWWELHSYSKCLLRASTSIIM